MKIVCMFGKCTIRRTSLRALPLAAPCRSTGRPLPLGFFSRVGGSARVKYAEVASTSRQAAVQKLECRKQSALKSEQLKLLLRQISGVSIGKEAKDCDGMSTGSGMVWRGGYAARVKAMLPTDASHCWHLLCWWRPCFLGALPSSLWSKDNGSKESQVGIMRSNLYKLDISLARAALQSGMWTAEHSSLRQTWIQACIVSWKLRIHVYRFHASCSFSPGDAFSALPMIPTLCII